MNIVEATATNNMTTHVDNNAGAAAGLKYQRITVTTPARLHLGFLDLNSGDLTGGRGRRFGGLGITLDGIHTRLSVERAYGRSVSGDQPDRAARYVSRMVEELGLGDGLEVSVEEAIPEHAGLGSGTQLALAAGIAVSEIHGLDLTPREVAALLDRGRRSGIGIAAFEAGGVVLDGGRGQRDEPPPVICRIEFPPAWRILLIFDHCLKGAHGGDEAQAFRDLPPFPSALSADLCRLMLISALPALAEADLETFSSAVAELQNAMGEYFAPVQGGRYTSAAVGEVLSWLHDEGVAGIGQSSWGPTGFALLGSEIEADRVLRQARERWAGSGHLDFMVCRGRNSGGEIDRVGEIAVDERPRAGLQGRGR